MESMVDLDAGLQGAAEAVEARGDDHELLKVGRVIGMHAPVYDVEHRDREDGPPLPGEVSVKGTALAAGGCVSECHGDAQGGIRSKLRLVRRAVELDEYAVE